MTISRAGVLLLPLLMLPVHASAQQQNSSYDRARAGLSANAAVQFERAVAETRARGLPVEPLVDKALEGEAKRVPEERVLSVVRQIAAQLVRARTLLGAGSATAELVAVADVLQQGGREDAILKLRTRATGKTPFALLVRTYGDLASRGVPQDRAIGLLITWDARGRTNDVRALADAVDRLVRSGHSPADAAATLNAGLNAGRTLESLVPALRSDAGAGAILPVRLPPI